MLWTRTRNFKMLWTRSVRTRYFKILWTRIRDLGTRIPTLKNGRVHNTGTNFSWCMSGTKSLKCLSSEA